MLVPDAPPDTAKFLMVLKEQIVALAVPIFKKIGMNEEVVVVGNTMP